MKNYITPCVNLIPLKENVVTASNDNFIEDDFDDTLAFGGGNE